MQDNQATIQQTKETPPAGLDAARHEASQRAAQQAEVLKETVFAAMMADAIGFERLFDGRTYKAYLDRLLTDSGNPRDPIARMMIEQLAMAHFRVGQLHVRAASAEGIEALKILTTATARLLGEFRRTALALATIRGQLPDERGTGTTRFKLLRSAT